MKVIWLIIGLGNPGAMYQQTRHNIGFMVVDKIVDHYNGSWTKKGGCEYASLNISGQSVIFLKPQNYMNNSGVPVAPIFSMQKISLDNVLVIHDDIALAFGDLRVKQGGGPGGHNGLKSLDHHIGNNYWRLRVGVGHPGEKHMVSDYVLSNFNNYEKLDPIFDKIVNNFESFLSDPNNFGPSLKNK